MDERARWIWFRPPPPARDPWGQAREPASDAFGHLRVRFTLDEKPARAWCRVTADGRYELFVNGARVGRGPARGPSLTYDTYDLARFLRSGDNVVAALVRHYGRPTLWWTPSAPREELGYGSFLFACEIAQGDGPTTTVTSGPRWRARAAATTTVEAADAGVPLVPPPSEGPPPLEIVDGARVPGGWTDAGFDDAGWAGAIVLAPAGDGFASLAPREAPPLGDRIVEPRARAGAGAAGTAGSHPLSAVYSDPAGSPAGGECDAMSLAPDTFVTVDFGGIVNAHPIVAFNAEPGTILDVACGEDLSGGKPVTAPREWAMRVVAGGRGGETHESFEAVGFRYLSVAARGGDVRSLNVRARERIAPRTPGAFFRCSDPLLEQIWEVGARTVDLCSTDALIDCPGREQRAWLGDAYLTSQIRSVIDPDPTLITATLRLHARGARADGLLPMVGGGDFSIKPDTIPDHSLLWIAGLRAHIARTGDLALAEELAPVAERALGWFERFRTETGSLANVPGWVFLDWAQLERSTHIAALDAMHAWALDAFAELCERLGNDGSAARARERAAATRRGFERYFDGARGVYVDAAGPDAKGRVSQQTNAMAIVAGCAPRERWDAMLDRICDESRLVRTRTPGDPGTFAERLGSQYQDPDGFDDAASVVLAQPFFAHFLHRAMVEAGRVDVLNDSMRRWRAMLDRGNGCFEEYWDAEPGLGSRCHAWSCTPVYDIATTVLGVRAHGPASVVVEPRLGDLAWAEGAVATPRGFVRVSVKHGEAPRVEAPTGVSVRIG